jgi:hypothetical protein
MTLMKRRNAVMPHQILRVFVALLMIAFSDGPLSAKVEPLCRGVGSLTVSAFLAFLANIAIAED